MPVYLKKPEFATKLLSGQLDEWVKDYFSRLMKTSGDENPADVSFLPERKDEPDTWWGGFRKELYNEFVRPTASVTGVAGLMVPLESKLTGVEGKIGRTIGDRLRRLITDESGELFYDNRPLAELLKKGKDVPLEFRAEALKRIEKALREGEGSGWQQKWEVLKNYLSAFRDDESEMMKFARAWGATSPETSVARTNYEALQAQLANLEGRTPFTRGNVAQLDITMPNIKYRNLNRAYANEPLSSVRGEPGKVEEMAQLIAGRPGLPIDVHALSGVGASEPTISKAIGNLRRMLANITGEKPKGYASVYQPTKQAYQHALDKIGGSFPQFWEGVKRLKGQGESSGLAQWLKDRGLLEKDAMMTPEALRYAIDNIDRTEFYGRGLKNAQVAVPELWHPRTILDDIHDSIAALTKQKGLPPIEKHEPVGVDPKVGERIAQLYQGLTHNPSDPAVQAAYKALRDEVSDQFQALQKTGLKIEPSSENYPSAKEMFEDITKNKRIRYYPSEEGFGEGTTAAGQVHPMLEKGKSGLPANDEFRVVHDVLAHGRGHSFSPWGEENAYIEHWKTLSPEARKALATETRGQNSWVHFGPQLERDAQGRVIAPVVGRPYAEQKAALLPDDVRDPQLHKGVPFEMGSSEQVNEIVNLTAKNKGATYNLMNGDLSGKPYFAVAAYPERTLTVKSAPSAKVIRDFIHKNEDLLYDPANSVGTWWDKEAGEFVLDITKTFPDREAALKLGQEKGEKAIFDLGKLEEIPLKRKEQPIPSERRIGELVQKFGGRRKDDPPDMNDRIKNMLKWVGLEGESEPTTDISKLAEWRDKMWNAGEVRAHPSGEEMSWLEHRSPQTNLTKVDPAFYGKGQAGAEKARAQLPGWIPRSYFNLKGSVIEDRLRGLPTYEGFVAKSKLYPLESDPLQLYPKAINMAKGDKLQALNIFDTLIQDAGFIGQVNERGTVALFQSLDVQAVPQPTKVHISGRGSTIPNK